MGKRKIFTKREYESLSKTHEGRQKINSTYCGWFIFSGVICIVLSVLIICIGYAIYSVIFFIFAAISFSVAVYYFLAYKRENEQESEHQQREIERLNKLKNANINEIDNMNGYEFETFVALILSDLGFRSITTKKSGDFGADVVLEKDGKKIIIQTKCYSSKVSISAVQEIAAARDYYHTPFAWVVTNNYFTKAAQQLAQANNIKLIDRDALANLIIQAKNIRTVQNESA